MPTKYTLLLPNTMTFLNGQGDSGDSTNDDNSWQDVPEPCFSLPCGIQWLLNLVVGTATVSFVLFHIDKKQPRTIQYALCFVCGPGEIDECWEVPNCC